MKKLLFIFLATLTWAANAQNMIAKSAADIAPLLIGEKIPNLTLKSSDNTDVQISCFLSWRLVPVLQYASAGIGRSRKASYGFGISNYCGKS